MNSRFPINLRKTKCCQGTFNSYDISGMEPTGRCRFPENFRYAWLGSHCITFICLDVGDINGLMNIHGVWLIKLIVLQKCLYFQGQFFLPFFLFASLASAWSFHQSCWWTPPSVLTLQPAHFHRLGRWWWVSQVAGNVKKKNFSGSLKCLPWSRPFIGFVRMLKLHSCYLCEQHVLLACRHLFRWVTFCFGTPYSVF